MAVQPIQVLVIEDNPGDVLIVREALAHNGAPFALDVATSLEAGLRRIEEAAPDVLLLDLGLPDSHGLETFTRVSQAVPSVPVVIMTVAGDEELAVRAVTAGAQDYLFKNELPATLLPRAIRYAIERHKLLRRLESIRDDLQTFTARAAHDLRAPIATVAGLAEVLHTAGARLEDEELEQLVSGIRRQSRHVSDLASDLLDLAKVHMDVQLEAVDVRGALETALQDVPAPAGSTVSLHVADGLRPVAATPRGLVRLITNLLTNAYRYGGDAIEASAEDAGGGVRLSIHDSGSGVADDVRDDLFTPFAQGADAVTGSTGLGLSIAKELAQSFGGDIRYDTEADGGCFVVEIPYWHDPQDAGTGDGGQ